MANNLYWEDVEVGTEVTSLPKIATSQMLVKWAGASGDFNPLHYDNSFAVFQGAAKPIVTGQLKRAWLVQLITDWIGEEGTLKKFSCRFRAVDYPRPMKTIDEYQEGDTWWCKGKVTKKYLEDGKHYLNCNVWVEDGKGEVTTTGRTTVILPSKG